MGVNRGALSGQKCPIGGQRGGIGVHGDAIGVQVDLDAGGGVSVALPLPQSIPVEYLMDAVTASEHPRPRSKTCGIECKKIPDRNLGHGCCCLGPVEIIVSPSGPTCLHCTLPGKVLCSEQLHICEVILPSQHSFGGLPFFAETLQRFK